MPQPSVNHGLPELTKPDHSQPLQIHETQCFLRSGARVFSSATGRKIPANHLGTRMSNPANPLNGPLR